MGRERQLGPQLPVGRGLGARVDVGRHYLGALLQLLEGPLVPGKRLVWERRVLRTDEPQRQLFFLHKRKMHFQDEQSKALQWNLIGHHTK